jgi:UDP-N-acetylglucosamine 2-epimerase (non-hydrolysing)
MKIVSVFGTRPEAIKMAPVIREIARHPEIEHVVCVTGQHREMLDQALDVFKITPDRDLRLMGSSSRLGDLAGNALSALTDVLAKESPDLILVQGDTATTLAGALAGFYLEIPVGHIEAGLRTHDLAHPWPEEGNRKLVSGIASLHFAPTPGNRANLLAEGVPDSSIIVTGNTVIDALYRTRRRIAAAPPWLKASSGPLLHKAPGRKLILVTAHRRENFGARLEEIWEAMTAVARRDDCDIVYPLHLNPSLSPAATRLRDASNIKLIGPLDYVSFVYLLERTDLILTDSGGIQEEATALGKPVLLMREVTERPEALEAGTVRLVGTDADRILATASRLLDDPAALAEMSHPSPVFGDGSAAGRIVSAILQDFSEATSPRDIAAISG